MSRNHGVKQELLAAGLDMLQEFMTSGFCLASRIGAQSVARNARRATRDCFTTQFYNNHDKINARRTSGRSNF